jgi:diaminohydroxyphosphoribosylaminopyrimidine deaminase/5-amino-6-(5-phosphoribosylamino)uracil reductase
MHYACFNIGTSKDANRIGPFSIPRNRLTAYILWFIGIPYFCLVKIQENYMRRCILLAKKARGTTAPNPAVGCVIVHGNKIIGEGFTSPYGGPHAEVNAIESVKEPALLTESTIYISLEPCSHFGKTPPCADLIVKHKIPNVVIGVRDPNELVAGSGIKKLQRADHKITEGVLEDECRNINRDFFRYHQQKRPYFILKWAQSSDGYMAPAASLRTAEPKPYWITNSQSRQLVHKWRTEEQAILVGTRTVLEDNPKLNARKWHGKSPIRIVLDQKLRIPSDYHVFDQNEQTIVLTAVRSAANKNKNLHYETLDFTADLAPQIAEVLYKNKILSVLIEGGAKTLETFIDSGMWDEARVFTGAEPFYKGLKAPKINGSLSSEQEIGSDMLKIIRRD